MIKSSTIQITEVAADYELLDSGEGEKLERFGKYILSRPDPQALWGKGLPASEWKKADGTFTRQESGGSWSLRKDLPASWPIDFGGLKFLIKPTAFKHVGLFPEQAGNWEWLQKTIEAGSQELGVRSENFEALNLFGYTGGATLACAKAGAKVVHIDGSKAAMAWARENAALSGLGKAPIRWIVDDARSFVKREIKRERKYDGIIMDPPAFGHGPESELWKIEEHFLPLVEDCIKILKDKPQFFLINGYASGYSAIAYENLLQPLVERFGGSIETGELTIAESTSGRLLPCGIFARWLI